MECVTSARIGVYLGLYQVIMTGMSSLG